VGVFSLKLLGGASLTGPSGPLSGRAVQRRQVALLALLGGSRSKLLSRDKVTALLWPESTAANARASLSDTLHVLRKALGDEALLLSADDLELNGEVVWCDVQAFRGALRKGRPDEALSLYAGPFLDGFHFSGSPEFERWADGERDALRREAREVADALAAEREAAGDLGGAVMAARRALALVPHDEAAARQLMRLLAAAGDRAGAVAEYESFARGLRTDLELDPSPETGALAESIRNGDVPSSLQGSVGWQVPENQHGLLGSVEPPPPPPHLPPAPSGQDGHVHVATSSVRWPGDTVGGGHAPPGRPRHLWIGGLVLVPALVAAVLWVVVSPGTPRVETHSLHRPVKVTTALGVEESPSWSPDGGALAYQSDHSGNWDIWVTQLLTGEAVNRTADSPFDDTQPTWSPDGRWIAFFSTRDGGGYFVMPGVGGTPRKVAPWPSGEEFPAPAPWSPDGTELAYALGQRREPRIEVLTLATGESRSIPLPARPRSNSVADLTWSPDGRWMAYRRCVSPIAATSELWITRLADGESLQLTNGSTLDRSPTWSPDSRTLYFVSDGGGSSDLWSFRLDESGQPAGPPQQVTVGLELTHAALDAAGGRIAYTTGLLVRNVFRAPLLTHRPATWSDVTQLTFEEVDFESIDVSSDGHILLSSNRSGNWDIHLLPAGGGALRPLTTDPALDAGPRLKPDGAEVLFYSSRTGHRQVWIMSSGGGRARQITTGDAERWYPSWSPSGGEVVAQGSGLVVVSVQDGAERQLTDSDLDIYPDWSPDGEWIAFTSTRDGPLSLWLVPSSGGTPERVLDGSGRMPRWSADSREIYFLEHGDRGNDVWVLPLESRQTRPITDLAGRRGRLGRAGLATDGHHVYFTWEESRGDIWAADLLPRRNR
jgi:Tol biopolymer transport system component/DNA-binding SARP family transcriptional activator